MEEFESLTSIVREFGIKSSTLNLFKIKWKTPTSDRELEKFVQVPYGPSHRGFGGMPLIIDTRGNQIKYGQAKESAEQNKSILEYDDATFGSDFELNDTSTSTNLTQFMSEYNINEANKQKSEMGTGIGLSDIILDSTLEGSGSQSQMLSSDFAHLSSTQPEKSDPICSTPDMLNSEAVNPPELNSEPFDDLATDSLEILQS